MPSVIHSPLRLLIATNLRQAWRRLLSVRDQSPLLVFLIGVFIAGYFGLAFLLFYKGLMFIGHFPGLGTLLSERLLFLMFAFLFFLLWFSNLVIGYTNLFKNRETSFLMSLPIPSETIFQWKFIESTLLASWAFVFLIAPLLVAFGMTRQAEWHYYIVAPLFMGLFILLPAVGGTCCAIMLARYLDRKSFQIIALGACVLLLILATFALKPTAVSDEMLETRVIDVLDRLLVRTRFAQFPGLPSYWLSAGVMYWSEGAVATSLFFGMVLLSHALFFGSLAFTWGGRVFFEASSATQSRGGLLSTWKHTPSQPGSSFDAHPQRGALELIAGLIPGLRPDVRALCVKDARMFWRDTTQWGQTLVLFGLLGMYIINLRHFSQQFSNPFWVNLVSYLNLLACSLNLATLTTRFVYPQFSLEGKRSWIVGMAPMGLARVITVKFWFALTTALTITVGLMGLSCHMLQIPWGRTLFFIGAVTIMTFTLTAMAVGLGVVYPNFKEDNPSKIVSGFGGTFCLVLSFIYIATSIVILATGAAWAAHHAQSLVFQTVPWLAFALWSALVGVLPLGLGLRKAGRFEIT